MFLRRLATPARVRCFAAAPAGGAEVESFGRALFRGKIALPALHPYPEVRLLVSNIILQRSS